MIKMNTDDLSEKTDAPGAIGAACSTYPRRIIAPRRPERRLGHMLQKLNLMNDVPGHTRVNMTTTGMGIHRSQACP